ncbi:MAG: hypothetical protein R2879_20580 [Saprospiraceae bacterium]
MSHKLTSHITLVWVFINILILFTSCEKELKPVTAEDFNGNWKMVSVTAEPAVPGVGKDIFATLQACSKDDVFQFQTPKLYRVDQGELICDPNSQRFISGSFALNPETREIAINDGTRVSKYTVGEITDEKFVLIYGETINYQKHTYEATFNKVN